MTALEVGQRLHRAPITQLRSPPPGWRTTCHDVFVLQADPLIIIFTMEGVVHVWPIDRGAGERDYLHDPEACDI